MAEKRFPLSKKFTTSMNEEADLNLPARNTK